MEFVLIILLLAGAVYGGFTAWRTLAGVKLLTVPGAILGSIGFCQFVLFAVAGLPIVIVGAYFNVELDPGHVNYIWNHSFALELSQPPVQISDIQGLSPAASEISGLTARVDINGATLFTTVALVVAFVAIWVLAFFMLNLAAQVLRSLYERTPFVAENPARLRRIAGCWLGAWLVFAVYTFIMTVYLQSQLNVTGGDLGLVDIPWFIPLFSAGLILVLAEVFRVGNELKKENEMTV